MADIETNVNELVEDLKNKINDINLAVNSVVGEDRTKAIEIRDKAVSVLVQASGKIVETAKTFADSEEVNKGVEIVKTKSKELYDNAMNRITEILEKSNVQESDVVEEISEPLVAINEEIVKNVVQEDVNSIAGKARNTLRDWLKLEGK